jgi:hypothetical protein
MCKFCRILHFILKVYHNFDSYQNMLNILAFFFNIINYNFVLYVMHITPHLHVVKDCWKCKILINTLNLKKKLITYLLNFECFLNLGSRFLSSKFFYYQNYVITIVLYLVLCKINHIWHNTYSNSNVLLRNQNPKQFNEFLIWILELSCY